MDIISEYRIRAGIPSETELARYAERARVVMERTSELAAPVTSRTATTTSTGSLACVPVTH